MKKEINSLEELIENPSFINWVYHSNAKDVELWNRWLERYPEKGELMEDAAMVVKGIAFKKQSLAAEEIEARWIALETKINQNTHRSFWFQEKKYAIAATITLIVLSALSVWFIFHHQTVVYTTKSGEMRNLILPDSSKVTLNANSTLNYHRSSFLGSERKIYLKGEAYFEVVKKNAPQPVKFVVVTENAQVEVLGTQFNVNNRRGKTRVVLNSGKVKFNASNNQNATLEPGDMVEYSKENHELTLQKVDPDLHSSWRNQKLKFDDTSLIELAEILEDNYGLKVIINNQDLYNKKITGEISAENVDVILKAVSGLFKIKISRSGNTIYFS